MYETPLILDSHVPKEPGLLKAHGLFTLIKQKKNPEDF